MAGPDETDETVVVPRGGGPKIEGPGRRSAARWPLVGAAVLVAGVGGGTWWIERRAAPPPAATVAPIAVAPAAVASAPVAPVAVAPVAPAGAAPASVPPAAAPPAAAPSAAVPPAAVTRLAAVVPATSVAPTAWVAPAPDVAPPAAVAEAPLAPPLAADIRSGDERTILDDEPKTLTMFRFTPNPEIMVLDFPTLRRQGNMLNRLAVFVEKAGAPHDRLLDDRELAETIRQGGDDPDTYYYGHDYRSADIARFFRLAETEHIALNQDEQWLAAFARMSGWLDLPAGEKGVQKEGALLSIPRVGSDSFVDRTARAVILHHELSHGEYFTNPQYSAYVNKFWRYALSDADRAAFRAFLASEKYDAGIEDLMINEMQAYLMHTHDPRFFSAAILKLPQQRIDDLQGRFYVDMPNGWLRDCTTAPALATPPPPSGGISGGQSRSLAVPPTASARPRERRQLQ